MRQKLWSSPFSTSPQMAIRSVGHADLVAPDAARLFVVLVGRRTQSLERDAVLLGQQLDGPVDGLALEVVAKAPVAEHLEERVVARRPAHFLEVVVLARHAQAALVVDSALVRARLLAGQHVLELDHARVAEEQGRVAGGHQRRAGHDGMAAFGEEVDEAAAYLVCRQVRDRRLTLPDRALRHDQYGTASEQGGGRAQQPPAGGLRRQTASRATARR